MMFHIVYDMKYYENHFIYIVKIGLYDMVGQPTLCRITTHVVVNKQVQLKVSN